MGHRDFAEEDRIDELKKKTGISEYRSEKQLLAARVEQLEVELKAANEALEEVNQFCLNNGGQTVHGDDYSAGFTRAYMNVERLICKLRDKNR